MYDVDRLFKCSKCGISPPQSASGWGKRFRGKPKQGSAEAAGSPSKEESPSGSDAANALLCTEKEDGAVDEDEDCWVDFEDYIPS